MNKTKLAFVASLTAISLLAYTKFVWQSGFDQGADVSLCLMFSILEHDLEKIAIEERSCKDAEAYKSNPLWQLRRRS